MSAGDPAAAETAPAWTRWDATRAAVASLADTGAVAARSEAPA